MDDYTSGIDLQNRIQILEEQVIRSFTHINVVCNKIFFISWRKKNKILQH